MSIKSAIDKLTGKSSKNIEDAISKLEIGGESSFVYSKEDANPLQLLTSYNDLKKIKDSGKPIFLVSDRQSAGSDVFVTAQLLSLTRVLTPNNLSVYSVLFASFNFDGVNLSLVPIQFESNDPDSYMTMKTNG